MKTTLLIFLISFFCFSAVAQNAAYITNLIKAQELYKKKDYAGSANAFSLAIASNGGIATKTERFNAGCSWALAGNADSAFHYLYAAVEKNGYDKLAHITTDGDLKSLHSDGRWNDIIQKVRLNKEKSEVNYIKPVVAILDTIYIDDQRHRKGIEELISKEGLESPIVKERFRQMDYADSINLLKIEKILDEYGWLGYDQVGSAGATTLFMVIQHSHLKVQKKYLPMMRKAVKDKKLLAANLAMLEDRIALREGRKQTYGSQVSFDTLTRKSLVPPLEDPENIDKRRATVGLGPYAEYLRFYGIEWNLQEYKKQQKLAAVNKKRVKKKMVKQ